MSASVDDMIKMLARRGDDVADAASAGRKADKAAKAPDGLDAFMRLVPPPRESVPRPRDPRAENVRVVEEGEGFRKVGFDEFNSIDITTSPDAHQISTSFLLGEGKREGFKGKGLGVEMYMKAVDDALAEGKVFKSDTVVSIDAQRVWEALERRGYILERNPRARLRESDDWEEIETLIIPDEEPGDAVFTIVGKQQGVQE